MQILQAVEIVAQKLRSFILDEKIIAQSVISYDEDKILEDLDLIYVKYLNERLEGIEPVFSGSIKSKLIISGNHVIDWENGLITDMDGNIDPVNKTWISFYGEFPIFQFYIQIDDDFININIPFKKMQNGDFEIEATGMTDIICIIA